MRRGEIEWRGDEEGGDREERGDEEKERRRKGE